MIKQRVGRGSELDGVAIDIAAHLNRALHRIEQAINDAHGGLP